VFSRVQSRAWIWISKSCAAERRCWKEACEESVRGMYFLRVSLQRWVVIWGRRWGFRWVREGAGRLVERKSEIHSR
jgi:hypothetical protein